MRKKTGVLRTTSDLASQPPDFGQELERHKTIELGVLSLVHNTHAAAAQLFDDAVVREALINEKARPVDVLGVGNAAVNEWERQRSNHRVPGKTKHYKIFREHRPIP